MNIVKDKDTFEQQVWRQEQTVGQSRKAIPVVLLLLLPLAIAITSLWFGGKQVKSVGDPYHCSDCKSLGIACKEHRDFDSKQELLREVEEYSLHWNEYLNIQDGEKFRLYGEGNTFNTECDFCLELQSECYGCEYTRLRIESIINDKIADEIFITKLCDSCWKDKRPECDNCKSLLFESIREDIENKK